MKKDLLHFMSIAIMLLFVACSNEAIFKNDKELSFENNPEIGNTISLTASMPDEDSNTRVGLKQETDKAISLTWEASDELQLVFVQGQTKIKSTAKVLSIFGEGKSAQFEIVLPEEIESGAFNLYGVYGGDGLSDDNPIEVKLPKNPGDAVSLATLEEKKHVMLYFASKNMEVSNPQVSVMFQHIGSLFSITLKNSGATSLDNLSEARLVGVGGDGIWAFNSGVGGEIYDLVTGKFQNSQSAVNYISFKAEKNSLLSGNSITFWGWYPPLPDKKWPELKLQLRDATDIPLTISVNSKTAQTAPLDAGKSYYLFAEWDGSQLNFTEEPEGELVDEAWFLRKTNGETEKFFPICAWRIPGCVTYGPGEVDVYNRQARNINTSFHYIPNQRKDIIYMSIKPSQILMEFLSKIPEIKNKGNEKGYYESQYMKNIENDNVLKNKLQLDLTRHINNQFPNVERAYLPIDEVSMGLASNYWYTPPVVGDWIYRKLLELEKQKDPNYTPIVYADLAGHGKGSAYFFEKRYLQNHSSMPNTPPYEATNESAQRFARYARANAGLPLLAFMEGFNGVPVYNFSPTSYTYTYYTREQLKSYHYENIKAYAQAYKGNGNVFGINAFMDFRDHPVLAGTTVDAIRAGLGDPTVPIWLFFDGNGYARPGSVSVDDFVKQVRCQMYTSITHGATGVFFWNNPSGQEVWDALQPTLEEMKSHLDIFKLKTLEKRDDDNLHIMIKKDDKGQKYIIASNTSKTSYLPLNVYNVDKDKLAPLEVYVAPF